MSLRFSCLILDHDDTAVDSTSLIHYPAHVEVMRQLRPLQMPVNLENWFLKNFDPGIMGYLQEELAFNPDEMSKEFKVWQEFTARLVPNFYPGFIDLLREFRWQGGIVTVVSHSEVEIIKKHYQIATNGNHFLPDAIFGWHMDEAKRKPSPYPVQKIIKRFQLSPQEVLVVDDLKPGVEMAKSAGVPVAAAGWCHQIEEIRDYMLKNCNYYLSCIEELSELIFSAPPRSVELRY